MASLPFCLKDIEMDRTEYFESRKLKVRRLDESDFAGLRERWSDLIKDSNANPLFMSWEWLYSWWEVWSEPFGLKLVLFVAFDEVDRLVGIAPFFLHSFSAPLGMKVRRLHFLGNAWRIAPTVRTEYSGLIARQGFEKSVAEAVLSEMSKIPWDEMVVCDQLSREMMQWQETFGEIGLNALTVPRALDAGVRVAVDGQFSEWLSALGPNTRLKAYNRWKYLKDRGNPSVEHTPPKDAEAFLDTLNDFHRERWGKPCFDEKAVAFHKKLLNRWPENQIALSKIRFNGRTVSVLYDITAGRTRYNLQAGFEEEFDPKVALGTLHLGYAIEQSFYNPTIEWYDLLAGPGKNCFYKSRFQGEKVDFLTVQFARHPVMRLVYRVQSWLPGSLRQSINRFVGL